MHRSSSRKDKIRGLILAREKVFRSKFATVYETVYESRKRAKMIRKGSRDGPNRYAKPAKRLF